MISAVRVPTGSALASMQDTYSIDPGVVDPGPPPPGCSLPWSSPPSSFLSPEEEMVPLPCSFTPVLHYLSKPYDQFYKEDVIDYIPTHVNPDFLKAVPELLTLLHSDEFRKTFAPEVWSGLMGVEPLELQTTPNLPPFLRSKTRPVNPIFREEAFAEIRRMATYLYQPSTSNYSSPIVIAKKATYPFFRIAGDYRKINEFILRFQEIIPDVARALEMARLAKCFIDLDMSNSFHQIPLGPISRKLLAVATPLGLFEPLYAPEGVSPLSAVLQRIVTTIFHDYDWMIVIYDNFLICADNFRDAYDKLVLVLARCREYNLCLKMAKSYFGFSKVTFFGYDVSNGEYRTSEDRKAGVATWVFL
jgi:hypothetical protein